MKLMRLDEQLRGDLNQIIENLYEHIDVLKENLKIIEEMPSRFGKDIYDIEKVEEVLTKIKHTFIVARMLETFIWIFKLETDRSKDNKGEDYEA